MKSPKIKEAIAAVTQKQKECKQKLFKRYALLFAIVLFFISPALPYGRDFTAWVIAANGWGEYAILTMFLLWAITAIYAVNEYIRFLSGFRLMTQYEYLMFYKNTFIKAVIEGLGDDLTYEPKSSVGIDTLSKAQIYSLAAKSYGEDAIKGCLGSIKFTVCEVISPEREISGSGYFAQAVSLALYIYEKITNFSGTVVICELGNSLKTQTVIIDKKVNNLKIPLQKIGLCSAWLNDFNVFTDDETKARYLLSPGFMQRLREVKQGFDSAVSLSAAFMDDKFYLFLNGAKDRFESSLFDSPPSLADAQAIKDEIFRLLRVIDELNLSLDVYK